MAESRTPEGQRTTARRYWWIGSIIGCSFLVLAVRAVLERDDGWLFLAIAWTVLGLAQVSLSLYTRRTGRRP